MMKKEELENIRTKYQASITLKDSEGQIQWGRYNAMLVINTLLIGLIGLTFSKELRLPIFFKLIFLLTPAFGITVCDLWYKMTERGFLWTKHWTDMSRELEKNLPGGKNPVNEGYEIWKNNTEKEITKTSALKIIKTFRYIYIILLIVNIVIALKFLSLI